MSFQGITISKGTFAAPIGPGPSRPLDPNFLTPNAGSAAARAEFTNAPAARLRAAALQELSLSEDQLKDLGTDARRAAEAQLQDAMIERVKADPNGNDRTGLIAEMRV